LHRELLDRIGRFPSNNRIDDVSTGPSHVVALTAELQLAPSAGDLADLTPRTLPGRQ